MFRCVVSSIVKAGFRTWFYFVSWFFWTVNLFRAYHSVTPVLDVLLLQSATQAAAKIRRRELSSYDLVEAYIYRIGQVNPHLNAVVQDCFEEALERAREVDSMSEFEFGEAEDKPFLGVPFTLKDCIFVSGLICTAGIPNRRQSRAVEDAVCVDRMKEAGAIVLAITNVSEVCMWWESTNTIYGRTNNPYDCRRIVGGSSGGEGALLASGGSLISIGSDIGGSIRMPAFFNGVFGHKPTKQTVDDTGTVPSCHGFQVEMHCVGPLCRYAEDLKPMLKVLAGPEANKMSLDQRVDFKDVKYFYMEGLRMNVLTPLSKDMLKAMKKTVRYLETRYDVICHRVDLPLMHYALAIWMNDMNDPDSPSFAQEMTDMKDEINPLTEMCRWLFNRSPHTFPAIALAGMESVEKVFNEKQRRQKLIAMRNYLRRQFNQLLGDDGVFLFPSHPTTAPYHNQPIWQPFNWIYTGVFNSLGFPVTQCPLGLDNNGLPLGIQIVGPLYGDGLTISVAQELAYAFGGWKNSTL